jgi:hypothetical protein
MGLILLVNELKGIIHAGENRNTTAAEMEMIRNRVQVHSESKKNFIET